MKYTPEEWELIQQRKREERRREKLADQEEAIAHHAEVAYAERIGLDRITEREEKRYGTHVPPGKICEEK